MDAEDAGIGDEGVFSRVSAKVEDIKPVEILGEMFAHAVKRLRIEETVVRDKRDDALLADAFRCPFYGFHVEIVERFFVRRSRVLRIRFLDEFVQRRILSVLILIMLIRLPDVIRRIADDNEHRGSLLLFDARRVLLC